MEKSPAKAAEGREDIVAVRPAWLEIDVAACKRNVRRFVDLIGPNCKLWAVTKGNAYGHGLWQISQAAVEAGAYGAAVAIADEGAALREAGFEAPILILGETSVDDAETAVASGCTVTVAAVENARAVSEAARKVGKVAQVHIKVDSGMGRQGVRIEKLAELCEALVSLPAVEVVGAFTHFAVAESDEEFTRWQFERFQREAVPVLKRYFGEGLMLHCANTAAALLYPEMRLDAVRIGAALHGLNPGLPEEKMKQFEPTLELRAKFVLLKLLEPGDSVGYGRKWLAPSRRLVGLLPVGYADGYPRNLSGKAEVLVRGKRAPIVGMISMDAMMVDVTEIGDVCIGEEAVLIGRQGAERITVEELARKAGTIVQEIASRLMPRLPRVYRNAE